jgi:hypothetical protein
MKCPCCNNKFSLKDYLLSLLWNPRDNNEYPDYVTNKLGKLNSWYEDNLKYIFNMVLYKYNLLSKNSNNYDKIYERKENLKNHIINNTSFNYVYMNMADNIRHGKVFHFKLGIKDWRKTSDYKIDKVEIELNKIMNNPIRGIKVSIRGDESLIKPKDIIKIIDILNNLENYEMLEELIK